MRILKKIQWRWPALLLMLVLVIPAFSQDEEEGGCPEVENKKAVKFLEEGMNRKKNKKPARMEYLKKALDAEPDYAMAHYALGVERVRSAKAGNKNYRPAENSFKKAIAICPEVHYNAYYWLGEIAMGRNEYSNAVGFYEKYQQLTMETDDHLSDSKEDQIQDNYDFAKFFHDHYTNPVLFDPITVPNVSTGADEYLPLISPDNEYMFFTQKKEKAGLVQGSSFRTASVEYVEKFTRSKVSGNSFEAGIPLPKPFNAKDNYSYGGATVSIDNKHLFLTICQPLSNGYKNCDIYTTDYIYAYNEKSGKEEWHWTELSNMGENVNGKGSWESQPSLSSDGKTLYFATARETAKGIDIFYTTNVNGKWSPAQAVGPPINTAGNDKTPFMHSDSRTLYFSSDWHQGFGGYDVFMSKMDKNGNWTKPQNIGYPINSEEDEHGFIVSTDGKMVYFSSDKFKDKGGKGGLDILKFRLHKDARPEEMVFLKGKVATNDGKPLKNARIEIKNMTTKKVEKVEVDKNDGAYAAVITVEEKDDYVVNIKADNMAFNSHFIPSKETMKEIEKTEKKYEDRARDNDLDPTKAEEEDFEDVVKDVYYKIDAKLEEIKVGGVYRINNIYYKTNSADLMASSKVILEEFASYLVENPSMKIDIHGHTDDVGDAGNNLALSTDRAFSVMAYLQDKGVQAGRLSFKGFGETNPFHSNATAEGRAQNRRTEFKILAQ